MPEPDVQKNGLRATIRILAITNRYYLGAVNDSGENNERIILVSVLFHSDARVAGTYGGPGGHASFQ